jgi:hypothetical protein
MKMTKKISPTRLQADSTICHIDLASIASRPQHHRLPFKDLVEKIKILTLCLARDGVVVVLE